MEIIKLFLEHWLATIIIIYCLASSIVKIIRAIKKSKDEKEDEFPIRIKYKSKY